MTKNDIITFIENHTKKISRKKLSTYLDAMNYTYTSDEDLYMWLHDMDVHPTCPQCGNSLPFYNIKHGFNKFCSRSCNGKSDISRDKAKQTNLEKYGCENPFGNKEIQEKLKQTNRERYGCENPFGNKEIQEKLKQTNIEKYGVEYTLQSPIIREQIKQTNMEKYGCENPFSNKEIQEKSKQTNIERYGVKCTLQVSDVQEKIKQTNLKKYGCEHPTKSLKVKEKTKQTNIEKYGYEYSLQSPIIREQIRQTNIEKYGVGVPTQSAAIQKKIRQTNLERYGVECTFLLPKVQEKIKQTNIERYGCEISFGNKDVQEKSKQTNLERRGVEYPTQSADVRKKIKQTNLERYGTEYASQTKDVQEKIKQTNIEKYGVDYTFQSPMIREQIRQTNMERYGVENYNQKHISPDTLSKLNDPSWLENENKTKTLTEISHNLEVSDVTVGNYFKKYDIPITYHNDSYEEEIVRRYIKSIYPHDIIKYKIDRKEIDIYLPDIKVGIEYNGIYFHSTSFRDSTYHWDKFRLCRDNDIRLISIFSHEWNDIKDKLYDIIYHPKIYTDDSVILDNRYEYMYQDDYELIEDIPPSKHNNGIFTYYDCGYSRWNRKY